MSDSGSIGELRFVLHSQPDICQGRRRSIVVPIQSYDTSSAGSLPSTSNSPPFEIPSPLLEPIVADKPCTSAYPHEILDWTDLELFSHYITHTSLIIPFDMDDLYALRVGIPNLALRSKPLMSSILALAAVCKSHDLIAEQPQRSRDKILDMLIIADRHHRASLLQVQLDLPNAAQYDYVLANTTLMVLYASASHCLRIRLAETQTKDRPLPMEFVPAQSQWISLIRAAHLAFVGLFNDNSEPAAIGEEDSQPPPTITFPPCHISAIENNISPENGPTERTKELLFPILASSSKPALSSLHAKARAIWKDQAQALTKSGDFTVEDTGIQACFIALDILGGIMTEVFSAGDSLSPTTSQYRPFHSGLNAPSLGRLSTVSSWLRNYAARVTSSATTPRPLRRVIMAFLNRVPAEYLSLVQTTLDSIGAPTNNGQQGKWENSDSELLNPSAAHKLAIDIFAHWAVLVMLLDGVWWIGGIGAWELKRVVLFVRAQGWLQPPMYTGEHWWPESMYNVARELRNLRNAR